MNSFETPRGAPQPNSAKPGRSGPRRGLFAATMLVPMAGLAVYVLEPGAGGLISHAQAQTTGRAAARTPAAPAAAPPAATPVADAAPLSSNPAVAVLLERANFWRNQTQYDQALESLNRALALEPRNADALALVGQIQADRGNRAAAENALVRLRQAAPGDPRIDKIDQSLKVGPIPPDALADARRLAKEGRVPEAIDRYNRVLRGNPPPDNLAVEYYQTLAGTDNGWEAARDGLARTVRQNPQDLRAQLAYAQILTYRDGARSDGIARLSVLAKNPAVADQATQAWRQAVSWLPQDKASIDALGAYLAAHPNDGDIAAKLEAARNPPPNPNDPAADKRLAGFEQLNKGRLTEAASAFQSAIATNANDADATGGLGIVRLRQKRYDEARQLLNRAMTLDPANRGRWSAALNGVSQAIAGSQPNPATVLMQRGNYAAAEANLQRQIATGNSDIGLRSMLADAQMRQNKTAAAEQTYRDILARSPRSASAMVGLAGILSQEGRHEEALGLLQQAQAAGGGDSSMLARARAQQLREQAGTVSDPITQAGLYRSAVAADPGNPWIRLDYARALVKQGSVREARAVMAGILHGKPSADALRAGILFANETNDPDAAASLLAQLPASARTPEMLNVSTQVELQRQIARVIDLPRATARARLLALAAQPDPEGVRGATIARSLASIGDSAAGRRAIIIARESSPQQGSAARIAYAGALLDIGDATGAQTMLAPLGYGDSLPPGQKQAFTQLRAGLAIKTSDDLNQAGKQAEGYDRLAPALASDPDNADMNLALARLYSGAHNPREALEINEALLRRDPANAEVRRGAVAAALALGNRGRAEQLVRDGIEIAPDDPKSWMASADVARASGNNARALHDLTRARELRLQQLGYSDNGDDPTTLTQVTLAPGADTITSRIPARVKLAGIGSNQAPGTAAPLYAGADLGQDVPDPLSIPPSFAPSGRPTPLNPSSLPSSFSSAPALRPQPVAAPTAQVYSPTTSPDIMPRGRVLDTTQADTLPPPQRVAQTTRSSGGMSADELNAQQLDGVLAPGYAPTYAQPTYVPPGAAPTYPGYQPAAAQQVAPGSRYQPQIQEYLPQYRPAPPPSTGQRVLVDDPQFPRGGDFDKPYRSYLPRINGAETAPFGQSTQDNGPTKFYDNPFRRSSADALQASAGLPAGNGINGPDPMTQEIDRSIVALRDSLAPTVQGGFGFRTRSGDAGLDKLTEITAPMEATFSPGGAGQLKLTVTPTSLNSGTVGGDDANLQRFGTLALGLTAPNPNGGTNGTTYIPASLTNAATRPGSQTAQGVGVGVQYHNNIVTADVGSTPVGFRIQNIVGGLEIAPQLSDSVTLRLSGERRAVTDSVLSYAGTRDTGSGNTWGGVVSNKGRASLEFSAGLANFYVDGAGGQYTGRHVAKNNEYEFGAGGSYPIYKQGGDEIRIGADLFYESFSKNLRFFTYGQGGYFSPQSYVSALIPVIYRSKVNDDLNYEVGGAVGLQSFTEKSSNYYPNNPALQAQLNAVPSWSGLSKVYPNRSSSGFAGNAHAKLDYRVSPNLHIGGQIAYQHSGDYDEAAGNVYARYIFNGINKR